MPAAVGQGLNTVRIVLEEPTLEVSTEKVNKLIIKGKKVEGNNNGV
jgi:hypothetical protein